MTHCDPPRTGLEVRRLTGADTDLWREVVECRYRNLYEPFALGRELATSELDHPLARSEVIHLVALIDSAVVGTGRMDLQPAHGSGPSAQIRYCAVDAACRGQGVGQALLERFESEARARGVQRTWMDARAAAVPFYARMGYVDIGRGPLKWGVVPHRVMEKRLAPA